MPNGLTGFHLMRYVDQRRTDGAGFAATVLHDRRIINFDLRNVCSVAEQPQQAVTARDESIAVTNRKRRQLASPLHPYPVSQPLAEIAARFPGTSPPLR